MKSFSFFSMKKLILICKANYLVTSFGENTILKIYNRFFYLTILYFNHEITFLTKLTRNFSPQSPYCPQSLFSLFIAPVLFFIPCDTHFFSFFRKLQYNFKAYHTIYGSHSHQYHQEDLLNANLMGHLLRISHFSNSRVGLRICMQYCCSIKKYCHKV